MKLLKLDIHSYILFDYQLGKRDDKLDYMWTAQDVYFKETFVPGPLSPEKTVHKSLMNMKSEDPTIKFEDQYETGPGLIQGIIHELNYPGELDERERSKHPAPLILVAEGHFLGEY